MSSRLDELRARAHAALGKLPGALGEAARKANDALGRPLADAEKLADMLAAENVPYKVSNLQEDAAAQMAVRRDSKGFRLPVVFIAGEPIGGRAELSNLIAGGELVKKVFG